MGAGIDLCGWSKLHPVGEAATACAARPAVRMALAAVIALFSASLGATTLEFSQADLQNRVGPQFPIQRSVLGIAVNFTDPLVFLSENENRIGVELTISVTASNTLKGKGRGMTDGTLVYKPATGQFVLTEPRLRNLKVENIPQEQQARVRETIDWVARNALSEIVVHQLTDKDFHEKMAKQMLKSIAVKNGKLVVELEMF